MKGRSRVVLEEEGVERREESNKGGRINRGREKMIGGGERV